MFFRLEDPASPLSWKLFSGVGAIGVAYPLISSHCGAAWFKLDKNASANDVEAGADDDAVNSERVGVPEVEKKVSPSAGKKAEFLGVSGVGVSGVDTLIVLEEDFLRLSSATIEAPSKEAFAWKDAFDGKKCSLKELSLLLF